MQWNTMKVKVKFSSFQNGVKIPKKCMDCNGLRSGLPALALAVAQPPVPDGNYLFWLCCGGLPPHLFDVLIRRANSGAVLLPSGPREAGVDVKLLQIIVTWANSKRHLADRWCRSAKCHSNCQESESTTNVVHLFTRREHRRQQLFNKGDGTRKTFQGQGI